MDTTMMLSDQELDALAFYAEVTGAKGVRIFAPPLRELQALRAAARDVDESDECIRIDGATFAIPRSADWCHKHYEDWPCRFQRLRALLPEGEVS